MKSTFKALKGVTYNIVKKHDNINNFQVRYHTYRYFKLSALVTALPLSTKHKIPLHTDVWCPQGPRFRRLSTGIQIKGNISFFLMLKIRSAIQS
jgi:hypothetical protein